MSRLHKFAHVLVIVVVSAVATFAQTSTRDYRRAHEHQILSEFTRLLAIPNVASDRENIRRNAQFIVAMIQRRGLNPQLLEAKTKDVPPAVFGEWKAPGATRAVVLYAHYDGQPVDPKQWSASPPFQPTWRSAAMEAGGAIVKLPGEGEFNPILDRSPSDRKPGVEAIVTLPPAGE